MLIKVRLSPSFYDEIQKRLAEIPTAFDAALITAVNKSADKAIRRLTEMTRKWKVDRVSFKKHVKVNYASRNIGYFIQTDSEIFQFVDRGTNKHTIRSKMEAKRDLTGKRGARRGALAMRKPGSTNVMEGKVPGQNIPNAFIVPPSMHKDPNELFVHQAVQKEAESYVGGFTRGNFVFRDTVMHPGAASGEYSDAAIIGTLNELEMDIRDEFDKALQNSLEDEVNP